MTNIDYFNFSLENNDEIVDFSNSKGELVISENLQNLTNLQNKNI